MDNLCISLRKQNILIAPDSRSILIKQLWYDNSIESLTLLDNHFTRILSGFSDTEIQAAALDWAEIFTYQSPLQQTPAYQALLRLWELARDAFINRRPIIMHLHGCSMF